MVTPADINRLAWDWLLEYLRDLQEDMAERLAQEPTNPAPWWESTGPTPQTGDEPTSDREPT